MNPSSRRITGLSLLILLAHACSGGSPSPGDSENDDQTPLDLGTDAGTTNVSLIDNNLWTLVTPEDDPFWGEAEVPENQCLPEKYGPEEKPDGTWFEVKTENCGYLTVEQSLLHAVQKGDSLNFRLWHFSISLGDEDYYLAIALGDPINIIWEAQVPVPSDSHLFYGTIPAPDDFVEGARVYFHISNHGANDWGLIELSLTQ
jgi:hypothetical protein